MAKRRRLVLSNLSNEALRKKYLEKTHHNKIRSELMNTIKFFDQQVANNEKRQQRINKLKREIELANFSKKYRKESFDFIAEEINKLGWYDLDKTTTGFTTYTGDFFTKSGKIRKRIKKKVIEYTGEMDVEFSTDSKFNADKAGLAVLNKMADNGALISREGADGVASYVIDNVVAILQQYVPFDLEEYLFLDKELDPVMSTPDKLFYNVRFTDNMKFLFDAWNKNKVPKKFERWFRKLKNIL